MSQPHVGNRLRGPAAADAPESRAARSSAEVVDGQQHPEGTRSVATRSPFPPQTRSPGDIGPPGRGVRRWAPGWGLAGVPAPAERPQLPRWLYWSFADVEKVNSASELLPGFSGDSARAAGTPASSTRDPHRTCDGWAWKQSHPGQAVPLSGTQFPHSSGGGVDGPCRAPEFGKGMPSRLPLDLRAPENAPLPVAVGVRVGEHETSSTLHGALPGGSWGPDSIPHYRALA